MPADLHGKFNARIPSCIVKYTCNDDYEVLELLWFSINISRLINVYLVKSTMFALSIVTPSYSLDNYLSGLIISLGGTLMVSTYRRYRYPSSLNSSKSAVPVVVVVMVRDCFTRSIK